MVKAGPTQLDVAAIIRQRLGARSRWVPGFALGWLERLICQDEMNALLRAAYPRRGADFCRAVMDYLDIDVDVKGLENMPDSPRAIFASNHPLGGLDGMALIDFAARYYGRPPLFVINDLLMAIEPLRDVFIPVNKHGAQSRESARAIDEAMLSDRPVLVFPAGLCSRRRNGVVADLQWNKMFVQKARQSQRTIVPLAFKAANSDRFYTWANRRERLGIKFNAEMVLLPAEVFKSRGKTFEIIVGKPIATDTLPDDPREAVAIVRRTVDSMIERN